MLSIRTVLTAATLALPAAARAQTWPSQPIRIVVPYPPGGLTDVLAGWSASACRQALASPR